MTLNLVYLDLIPSPLLFYTLLPQISIAFTKTKTQSSGRPKISAPIKKFLKIADKNSLGNFNYKSKNYEITLKKDAQKL